MTEPTILYNCEGPVAVLVLNRPDAGNTINMAMACDLERSVDLAVTDPAVRCVVLTGRGKLFCGGGDVAAMAEVGEGRSAYLLELARALHRSVAKLAEMPKPLVTLVNGPAAGAGLSLAIGGDVVLASDRAHFSAAYGLVGLTPDGGMSWLLPRLVGLRRAQEIILSNRRVSAEEAAMIGLVNRIVEGGDLMPEGLAVARALAAGPVDAISGARGLLAASFQNSLTTHLDIEATRIAEAGAGAEAREGIAAFLERRNPDFVEQNTP